MFNTIIRKTNEAKAVVGAAIATVKEIREERKEITTMIAESFPTMPKKEQKQYYYELSAYRVGGNVKN